MKPLKKSQAECVYGLSVVLGLLVLYYLVFVRDFISGKYIFGGDTYYHWSLNYMALYAVSHFNAIPWWDPTVFNGYPLYYHVLAGWSNYLSPYYLPSLLIFKLSDTLFGRPSINTYIILHRTLYVVSLNLLAVYLISRQLVRSRAAAVIAPLIFAFSYFQLLNIHDFYALEATIAPLFYIYALVRFNDRRTFGSFLLLILFAGLLLSSLDNGVVQSALFWLAVFSALLIIFSPGIIKDSWRLMVDASRSRKALLALGALLLISALAASWASPHYNLGNVIKYRGGVVEYGKAGGLTNIPITIERSRVWTVAFNWIPFPEIHDSLLNFSWDGHDYRYIGIVTIPLIFAAAVLGAGNRYVYMLFLTYFICNAFFIYTTDNLFYRILIDNSDLIKNQRNMSTIFPRGGPGLFLLFLSGIGLDALLRKSEEDGRGGGEEKAQYKILRGILGALMFIGFGLIFVTLIKAVPYRHTFFYAGLYLIIFSVLLRVLPVVRNADKRRWLLLSIFILTFMDLVISVSHNIDRKTSDLEPGAYHARIAYSPHLAIPDNLKFGPAGSELENMFPQNYVATYHNPRFLPWGMRAWLSILTSGNAEAFLPNYNIRAVRMRKYPDFRFYTNGYYIPFEEINRIQSLGLSKVRPLFFLHDRALVSSGGAAPEAVEGKYEVLDYTFNSVLMRTRTDRDGFLLFLDNYDRFWSAYLDGRKVKLHRANFTFKAVELPAGEHTVSWVYDPYPVKLAYLAFYVLLMAFAAAAYFKKGPRDGNLKDAG